MRHFKFIFSWMALGSITLTGQSYIDANPEIELEAGYTDLYVYRGRVLDEEGGPQGKFLIGAGNWSYVLFHHPGGEDEKLEEFSHSIEYTTAIGRRIQTMGYTYRQYNLDTLTTQELFYRVRHLNNWNPTYSIYYDFDAFRGTYIDLKLSRPWPLSRKLAMNFGLEAGGSIDMDEKKTRSGQVLEQGQFADDGFAHAAASLHFTYPIGKKMTLRTGYTYHHAFDDLLKDDPKTGENNGVFTTKLTLRLP